MVLNRNFLLGGKTRQQLDLACQLAVTRYLAEIGHDQNNRLNRRQANSALGGLRGAVGGDVNKAKYDDDYWPAAYMIEYHLQHCLLAYWSFNLLFQRFGGVPKSMLVLDLGAGTGAGRVGLALSLRENNALGTDVHFQAVEKSDTMLTAGIHFWDALEESIGIEFGMNFQQFQTLPHQVPELAVDSSTVVTAFHLSLPYDGQPFGRIGNDSYNLVQGSIQLVKPQFGLFSCHKDKGIHMSRCIRFTDYWDEERNGRTPIPSGQGQLPGLEFARMQGFFSEEVYDRTPWRFDLPTGYLYFRQAVEKAHDQMLEEEERPRQTVDRLRERRTDGVPTGSRNASRHGDAVEQLDAQIAEPAASNPIQISEGERVVVSGIGPGKILRVRNRKAQVVLDGGIRCEVPVSELRNV